MIYFKTQISEGIEIKIEVYGNEFYTRCPICGKEFNVDVEQLKEIDLDFAGTVCFCKECCKDKSMIDEFMNDSSNSYINIEKISVKKAAKLMGVSEQFVRVGIQKGKLPIGTAIQISNNNYTYHISPKLLKEYIGKYGVMNKEK